MEACSVSSRHPFGPSPAPPADHGALQMFDVFGPRRNDNLIEHRRREEALQKANRAKDKLLAMLGHELRNPLSPMVTALQILKPRGNAQIDKALEVVKRQVQRLTRLVDDLLDVSASPRYASDQEAATPSAGRGGAGVGAGHAAAEQRNHQLEIGLPPFGPSLRRRPTGAGRRQPAHQLCQVHRPGGHIAVEAHRQGSKRHSEREGQRHRHPPNFAAVFNLFTQGRQAARPRKRWPWDWAYDCAEPRRAARSGPSGERGTRPGGRVHGTAPFPARKARGHRVPLDARSGRRKGVQADSHLDDNEDALDLLAEVLRGAGHVVATATDGPTALVG